MRAVLGDARCLPFSLGGSWDLSSRACASAPFALQSESDGQSGCPILLPSKPLIKNGKIAPSIQGLGPAGDDLLNDAPTGGEQFTVVDASLIEFLGVHRESLKDRAQCRRSPKRVKTVPAATPRRWRI